MKRFARLLLALLLCFALAAPALADVIAEPAPNAFFDAHRREMTQELRYYYTNGAPGYVTLCREPEGRAMANLANGEAYFVHVLWENAWGLVEVRGKGEIISGWIPMEQMAEQYDSVSFAREHASGLTTLTEPRLVDIAALETLAIWEFPGAEAPRETISGGNVEVYAWRLLDGKAEFSLLYTDPLGRAWSRIEDSRFYGGLWVCLDAPEEVTPAYVDEEAVARQAGEGLIPPAEDIPRLPSFPWLALGLTGGAVLLAAVLLLVFHKKKAA